MSTLIIAMLLGMIFAYFGQFFSWIIGGILVLLTLSAALLIGGISLSALIMAVISILSYNLGIILALISPFTQKSVYN